MILIDREIEFYYNISKGFAETPNLLYNIYFIDEYNFYLNGEWEV